MAEALVDQEGPLRDYFQAVGDSLGRTIPGGLDVVPEPNETEALDQTTLLHLVVIFLMAGRSLIMSSSASNKEFAERFKYIIISSSILSDTVASAEHPTEGDLDVKPKESELKETRQHENEPPNSSSWAAPALLAAAFALQSPIAVLAAASWILQTFYQPSVDMGHEVPSVFDKVLSAVTALVNTSEKFDAIAAQALRSIEEDELRLVHHPAVDKLRESLLATCDTTKSQIDNIRRLFGPLTSELELKMLSEMYSPIPSTPIPYHRRHASSVHQGRIESSSKRASWGGSKRTLQTPLRRQFASEGDASFDSEESPLSASSVTRDAEENYDGESFGTSALSIQRQRKGNPAMGRVLQPSITPRSVGIPALPFDGMSPSHRISPFTAPSSSMRRSGSSRDQSERRHGSVDSLRINVQSCLASRRYAASHLLALRFNELPDDTYWEDTVEVITLLTSALGEASSLISSSIEETNIMILADQVPTPAIRPTIPGGIRRISDIFPLPSNQLESFAPMPDNLAMFAAHMDAMSAAIDKAKNHLRACVGTLQSPPTSPDGVELGQGEIERLRRKVVTEYSEIRRHLGHAIKECERGRTPLVSALSAGDDEDDLTSDLSRLPDPLPPSQEDSPYNPRSSHEEGGTHSSPRSSIVFTPDSAAAESSARIVDVFDEDKSHFYMPGDPFHLPPNQPEQVYEGESEVPLFARERSKLSREERVALAKKYRASGRRGVPLSLVTKDDSEFDSGGEKSWGPGGDVVRELKDVIYLVGEKRRGKSLTPTPQPEVSDLGRLDSPTSRSPIPSRAPPSLLPALLSPTPTGATSPLSTSSDGSRSPSPIPSPVSQVPSGISFKPLPPIPKRPSRPTRPVPSLPQISSVVPLEAEIHSPRSS